MLKIVATANRHSGASRNPAAQYAITVMEPTAIDSGLRRNDGVGGWNDGLGAGMTVEDEMTG